MSERKSQAILLWPSNFWQILVNSNGKRIRITSIEWCFAFTIVSSNDLLVKPTEMRPAKYDSITFDIVKM